MKKHFALLASVLLAFSAISCTAQQDQTVSNQYLEEIPSGSQIISKIVPDLLYDPHTLLELEELSEYVVQGTLLENAKQIVYRPDSVTPSDGVTISSFEISKVFKGSLKEGQTISLMENYWTKEEEDGGVVQIQIGYGPSEPNKEYLLFLRKEKESNKLLAGYYHPAGLERGRYPILDTDLGEVDFTQLGFELVGMEEEQYASLYKEVWNKYLRTE